MMSSLDVYVDACVIPDKGVGIGVYCPQKSEINAAEAAPRSLVGLDVNLAELFAIIRGMERAEPFSPSHYSRLVIYSDSTNAVGVARDGKWTEHYEKLKKRFEDTRKKHPFLQIKLVDGGGDHHHREADRRAKQGAENY